VHWYVDDALVKLEHVVLALETFFEFDVFVPERMSQEVVPNAIGTSFKEPV